MPHSLLLKGKSILGGALGVLLTSCSVYAPLQPSAPMLHDKGQAEVTGSVYLSSRLEGSVAYSPARHVLVRAAGGLQPDKRKDTYFRIQQVEVGAGTYRALSERWLVGGLGGYGRGQSSRRFTRTDEQRFALDTITTYAYAARFHKIFGEAFVAYEDDGFTMGLAYRLSQVRFSSLTNNGQPLKLQRMTRSEPMFFMRFGDRQGVFEWAQLQLGISTSWSPDYGRGVRLEQQLADIKEARLFTSIGLVVYPHKFRKHN